MRALRPEHFDAAERRPAFESTVPTEVVADVFF